MLALIVGRENGEEMVEIKTGCVCVSVCVLERQSVCVRVYVCPRWWRSRLGHKSSSFPTDVFKSKQSMIVHYGSVPYLSHYITPSKERERERAIRRKSSQSLFTH